MFRSSIFSFDTLNVRWRIPRCVLFAVICIGLAEALLGRTDFIWKQVPESGLGELLALETSIIRRYPKPEVLIFGSSRARSAFLPTLMEEQMGLQRGQVLNLGMGGARPFDHLKIYERNREILAKASTVIIEVDAEQFGTLLPNDRFRYLMGWSDWLAYKDARLSLTRSFLFRLPDAFPYLRIYVKHWLTEGRTPGAIGIDKYGRLALVRIADDYDENISREETVRYVMDLLYKDYEYSDISERYLVKLVRLAKEDGAKVYLVHMPLPENYITMLKRHHRNPYGQFTKNVSRAVVGLADVVQFWEIPAEVGLSVQDFCDIEHLNTSAAVKWSKFFVHWLREVHVEEKNDYKIFDF